MATNSVNATIDGVAGGLRQLPASRSLAFTVSQLLWAAPVGLLAYGLSALRMAGLSQDTFFCLDVGRYIAGHGLPHANHFTAVASDRPWIDPQWLAHLFMFEAWSVAGYGGLVLAAGLAFGVAAATIVYLLRAAGISRSRAVLFATLAAVALAPAVSLRGQVFALPLFVATFGLGLKALRQRRVAPLLLTLPMLVLWANVHGSVLIGVVLVAACAAVLSWELLAEQRTRDAVMAVLTGVAACATPLAIPYRPGTTISYYQSVSSDPVLPRFVAEWHSPTLGLNWGGIFFFLPLAITLLAVGFAFYRRYLPPLGLLVSAAVTALIASRAVRFSCWFDLIAVVLIADIVQHTARPLAEPGRKLRALVAVAALGVAIAASASISTRGVAAFESDVDQPAVIAAGSYAGDHPRVKLLADEFTANFVLWRFPRLERRVAYDIRFEQYTTEAQLRYFNWVSGSTADWMAAANGYQMLVAGRQHPALVAALRRLRGWRTLYQGSSGIVVVREGAGNKAGRRAGAA